jgi:hypothetical protein
MTKCKNLKTQVTVGSHQYTTNDNITNGTYAYKREDPSKKGSYLEFPHFTVVDTGKGENEFKKYHYKFELNGQILSLKYFQCNTFDGAATPMTTAQQKVYDEQVARNLDTYHLLALEFWNGVQ